MYDLYEHIGLGKLNSRDLNENVMRAHLMMLGYFSVSTAYDVIIF